MKPPFCIISGAAEISGGRVTKLRVRESPVKISPKCSFLTTKSLKWMILARTRWILWTKFSREFFPTSAELQFPAVFLHPILFAWIQSCSQTESLLQSLLKDCSAVREPLPSSVPQGEGGQPKWSIETARKDFLKSMLAMIRLKRLGSQ